jgi:hypothetical protein
MTSRKPKVTKQPLLIRTHALTHNTNRVLEQLSQEATDTLGWTVSNSALVRALVWYAARQPREWKTTALFPLVEQEIATGIVWGSKKR